MDGLIGPHFTVVGFGGAQAIPCGGNQVILVPGSRQILDEVAERGIQKTFHGHSLLPIPFAVLERARLEMAGESHPSARRDQIESPFPFASIALRARGEGFVVGIGGCHGNAVRLFKRRKRRARRVPYPGFIECRMVAERFRVVSVRGLDILLSFHGAGSRIRWKERVMLRIPPPGHPV